MTTVFRNSVPDPVLAPDPDLALLLRLFAFFRAFAVAFLPSFSSYPFLSGVLHNFGMVFPLDFLIQNGYYLCHAATRLRDIRLAPGLLRLRVCVFALDIEE